MRQSVHLTTLACPSYSVFWPLCLSTRPRGPLCAIHSLESCFELSWWVVLGMQVCTVGGTAARTAPDAPQTRCKAPTERWKGTAVDEQADPA